ncbi:MAG: hypothetical protein KA885_08975 [Spirochaetes bacterium]|nr:hypothetical protein [Spirochaetota bacterium]
MRNAFLLIVIFAFISCKTTTEPIVYDKTQDAVEKEAGLIHYLIANDNLGEAGALLEKNLQIYPGDESLLILKGWALLQEKKYVESEQLFLEILKKNANNPVVYAGLSRIYRNTGAYDKANEYIDKGLAITKSFAILWFEKGLSQYNTNKYKEALLSFTKSYNLDKNYVDALFFKYLSQLYSGYELNDIKYQWENLVKSDKIKNYHFLYHAEALYKIGDKELGYRILTEGKTKYPEEPYILNFYAYVSTEKFRAKELESLDEATKSIEVCLADTKSIQPEFVDTYLQILELNGDKAKMNEVIDKYYLLFPESVEIMAWLKKIKSSE